jgi:hypothetical protein
MNLRITMLTLGTFLNADTLLSNDFHLFFDVGLLGIVPIMHILKEFFTILVTIKKNISQMSTS